LPLNEFLPTFAAVDELEGAYHDLCPGFVP